MPAKKQIKKTTKKKKATEPDLFTAASKQKIKPKEWKYPKGVRYADVRPGDTFSFPKTRNWDKGGELEELKGVVVEKGIFDSQSRYFLVKMINPLLEEIKQEDIRRFILKKK